jgi:hypothetical protein
MTRYGCPPLRINPGALVARQLGEQMARQLGQRMARQIGQRLVAKHPLFPQLAEYGRDLRRAIRRNDWNAALKAHGDAGDELQRTLLILCAQGRVDELADLAQVRTEARAQRRRPPRHEHDPVRGRRCPHAPPATSGMHRSEVAA